MYDPNTLLIRHAVSRRCLTVAESKQKLAMGECPDLEHGNQADYKSDKIHISTEDIKIYSLVDIFLGLNGLSRISMRRCWLGRRKGRYQVIAQPQDPKPKVSLSS